MQPIQFFAARAEDGALVPGAAVDVFVSGTQTRAALFADSLGAVPLGNPALADQNARVFFYSASTRIDIRIHRGAYVGPFMRDVVVTDPDDVLTLSNGLFRNIAQGLAETASGKSFQVIALEDEAAYAIYVNVGGVAVDTGKRVPARYLLDKVEAASQQNADAARAYAEGAQAYAGRNFGPMASDPVLNPIGEALVAGDRYFNSVDDVERVYTGDAWYTPNADGQAIQVALGSGQGAGMVGLNQSVGPGLTVAEYLVRNKLICVSGALLQQFIDFAAASGGGRDVTLVPMVYSVDSLTLKAGVDLGALGGNAMSVQHLFGSSTPKGLPILRCGAISADFVTVPSSAFANSIRGLIIDARQQVSGRALYHSDTASVERTGSVVENCLVWKRGIGAGWEIAAGHREGSSQNVFVRCSEDGTNGAGGVDTNAGEYGFVCHSIDWRVDRLWTGFARVRSLKYDGGACRFSNIDAWGCQAISAEISGTSSTWDRLQTDLSGSSGLLVNGAQNAVFDNYVSVNNCLIAGVVTDDVVFEGSIGGVTFKTPQMRGSNSVNMGYGFGMSATSKGLPAILNPTFATTYLAPFNDRCLAYADIHGGNFLNRPIRGNASLPVELNTNPLFGYFSGGAPVDWPPRNNGVLNQLTADVDLPSDGYYVTALRVVSSATGTSGANFVVLNPEKYKGRILVIKAIMKGDGTSSLGNQRLEVFDGGLTAGKIEVVPNDAIYGPVATIYRVPVGIALIQIRLVAANDNTAGLKLDATDISIRVI